MGDDYKLVDVGDWVSAGKRMRAEGLLLTVSAGDEDGRVIFRQSAVAHGSVIRIELAGDYEIRFEDYKHEWFKDWDRNATTKLHWHAFIIEPGGGRVTWDSVEVAAHASPDKIDADHMQQEYYRYLRGPVDGFGVDWEKDGADPDLQSAAKCYKNGLWWCWSFGSHC